MLIRVQHQHGFSLVELMISMAVGLLVIAGITSVFSNTVATSSSNLQTTRLNQEMRAMMELISGDLRRAGYYRDSFCTTDPTLLSAQATVAPGYCGDAGTGATGAGQTNPFDTIEIDTYLVANDCILFSYDYEDVNQQAATPDGIFQVRENYGYRRNQTNGGVGFVTRRAGGALCNEGGWQALSDSSMTNITSLQFSSVNTRTIPATGGVLSVREISITMTGQLVSDPTVTLTLQNSVRVLNDRFCPGAGCAVGI